MTVVHDANQHRFRIAQPEGDAILEYESTGPREVTFTHTFVPPSLRGRGLAEKLVQSGLAWAQQESLDVKASCSYVARYLERHPQPRISEGRPAGPTPEARH